MQIPLQITIRDVDHYDAMEQRIREKSSKLEDFFATSFRQNMFTRDVRIDIGVPGKEIVVNRDHHEDVYVALRDAFDAAKRQLEDYVRISRGDVKNHESKRTVENTGAAEE